MYTSFTWLVHSAPLQTTKTVVMAEMTKVGWNDKKAFVHILQMADDTALWQTAKTPVRPEITITRWMTGSSCAHTSDGLRQLIKCKYSGKY